MYCTATVNAYDALDKVMIAVVLRQKELGPTGASSTVETLATEIDSTGETDPREWLRDALVGLLEAL